MSYAIIGAGPSGLAAAGNLQRSEIAWQGYELAGCSRSGARIERAVTGAATGFFEAGGGQAGRR